MSQEEIVRSTPAIGRLPKRHEPTQCTQSHESGLSLSDPFLGNLGNDFDDYDHYIEETCFPLRSVPWSSVGAMPNVWSHDPSQVLMPSDTTGSETTSLTHSNVGFPDHIQSDTAQYEHIRVAPITDTLDYGPCVQSTAQNPRNYGDDYHVQSPQTDSRLSCTSSHSTTSIQVQPIAEYGHFHDFDTVIGRDGDGQSWPSSFEDPRQFGITASLSSQIPASSHPATKVDLPTSVRLPESVGSDLPGRSAASKRKPAPLQSRAKTTRVNVPQSDLSRFVVIFESAPGALANVKRRRVLDAPGRKAAKDVRKAGACHQCRFRKRTVGPW